MLVVTGVAAFLAFAPLIWAHGRQLFAKEHFQFFPVYLLAVLATGWQRWRQEERPPQEYWRIEPVSLGLGLAALAAAWLIQSPWLAACALLLMGNSALAWYPDAQQCWRLLAILIPLPLNLDHQLILRLQSLSSRLASRTLDVLDFPHLLQGNVIQLTTRRLFVEEACSGINSVYLLLAAVLFYVVLARVRMIIAVPLVASAVVWSVVANTIRIVTIAVAEQYWQQNLATGIAHDVLGIATTIIALLAIFSTNSLLQFWGRSISDRQIRETSSSSTNLTPTALWNSLTTSNLPLVYERGRRGLTMRVARWKLTLLLVAAFIACVTSPWSLQAWAQWQGIRSAAVALPTSSKTAQKTRKVAALADLSFPADQQSLIVAWEPADQWNGPQTVAQWTVSGSGWEGRLFVRGPYRDWQPPQFPSGAQREALAQQKIPVVKERAQMVVATAFRDDGVKLRSYVAMYRDSGELIPPRTQLTTQDVVERFRSPPASETSWLWQVELLVRQRSSLNMQDASRQQARAFGQLLRSVLQQWHAAAADSQERSP